MQETELTHEYVRCVVVVVVLLLLAICRCSPPGRCPPNLCADHKRPPLSACTGLQGTDAACTAWEDAARSRLAAANA